jgi:hypothetical protein
MGAGWFDCANALRVLNKQILLNNMMLFDLYSQDLEGRKAIECAFTDTCNVALGHVSGEISDIDVGFKLKLLVVKINRQL